MERRGEEEGRRGGVESGGEEEWRRGVISCAAGEGRYAVDDTDENRSKEKKGEYF